MAADVMGTPPVFLPSAPAAPREHRLALAAGLLSLLIFLAIVRFAGRPLPQVWAFIPIYESALLINDLFTAVLLFAQFTALPSRALLLLACGYLFTACMIVPHALTFPGLFSPTGLLAAGPQSTAWLYMFWHGVFPLVVIGYALLKDRPAEIARPRGSSRAAILFGVTAVVGGACALTLLATIGEALLPPIMRGNGYAPVMMFVVTSVWLLSLVALAVLWVRRPHSVLDLWLLVVMCAWVFDIALSATLNAGRFDLGFYAGRIYGLVAASFVLMMLVLEMGRLYARLAWLLETEQQERRRIFETSLDLILVVNRHGRLLRVSPSSMATLGYEPANIIGRNAADFVYPADLDAIREQMRLARRGHVIRNFATRYIHKDGRVVTLAWSGVWSEPEQRHFFIGRDVTEQKLAERMKDEFIATVSHELRTPLTSMAGSLGLLAGGATETVPESTARLLKIAHASSQKLVRLVNDILDIGNIESGKMPFSFRRIAVKPLIEQAIRANRSVADHFHVPVRLDPESAEADVCADADRLTQAITNLLSNAVKFSPRDQEVVISIASLEDNVRISVRDRGPGIPVDFKSRIYEKFAQVDATDARRKGGTGLGLSIVKQIVTRLGGNVGFEPVPEGGTIFYVDVPRWDPKGPVEFGPIGDARQH